MEPHGKELAGTRVLIAEDEPLIAMDHADRLTDAGAEIVRSVALVSQAIACVEQEPLDVAVIDFVLADGTTEPLQEALEAKQVPFVIVSAYPRVLVRRSEDQEVHAKPISGEVLCSAVKDAVCKSAA